MGPIIWVHEDALGSAQAVFEHAGQHAKAVFVWDKKDFKARGHSLKKLVFIYECLQDLDVDIIRGHTTEILESYCQAGSALYFSEPRNPELLNLIAPLRLKYDVIMVERSPLGGFKVKPEMKRFFRYWNKARTSILKK